LLPVLEYIPTGGLAMSQERVRELIGYKGRVSHSHATQGPESLSKKVSDHLRVKKKV
jgi:hypothetical protein